LNGGAPSASATGIPKAELRCFCKRSGVKMFAADVEKTAFVCVLRLIGRYRLRAGYNNRRFSRRRDRHTDITWCAYRGVSPYCCGPEHQRLLLWAGHSTGKLHFGPYNYKFACAKIIRASDGFARLRHEKRQPQQVGIASAQEKWGMSWAQISHWIRLSDFLAFGSLPFPQMRTCRSWRAVLTCTNSFAGHQTPHHMPCSASHRPIKYTWNPWAQALGPTQHGGRRTVLADQHQSRRAVVLLQWSRGLKRAAKIKDRKARAVTRPLDVYEEGIVERDNLF